MKGWTTLEGLRALSRAEVLDANDLLDAFEEAEAESQKAEGSATGSRGRRR